MVEEFVTLDLRPLPPFERHTKIFATWASLDIGQTLRIINDHDPKPLYYHFEAEQKGKFEWKYEKRGPRDWIVAIKRLKSATKKDAIKDLIRAVHAGEDPRKVRERGKDVLKAIDPMELALIEQELVDEGLTREEIRRLCDVHLELFGESLVKTDAKLESGHPIHTLMEEHRAILGYVEALRSILERIRAVKKADELRSDVDELRGVTHHLMEAEKHYQREEEALFPVIEEYGIVEPPQVMRLDHVDLRKRKEALSKAASSQRISSLEKFVAEVEEAGNYIVTELPSHISREDNILYPIALQTIKASRWSEIRRKCDAIGYCCFTPSISDC